MATTQPDVPSAAGPAFVSYCRADADFVLTLAGDLKAGGASVWVDQRDLAPGTRWDAAIQSALSAAGRILVVLSPAAVRSTNVMDEVSFALDEGKTVIPIIYQECVIPFRLRRLQHVDFRHDYDGALKSLLKTLTDRDSAAGPEVSSDEKFDRPRRRDASTGVSAPSTRGSLPITKIAFAVGILLVVVLAVVMMQQRARVSSGDGGSTSPDASGSPTSKDLATGSAAAQPVRLSTLRGHTGKIWSTSFDRNGTLVVTASEDQTARVWDIANGKALATLRGHTAGVSHVLFNPSFSDIITSSLDDTIRMWGRDGSALGPLPGAKSWIAPRYDPRGLRLVTSGGDFTAVVTGSPTITLVGHSDVVEGARFSPAGERIVTASRDGTARVWNATDGRLLVTLKGHTDYVFDAAFSADSRRIVTASGDNTVRIWNAVSGEAISTLYGHTQLVFSAGFSPDGERVVSVSGDRTVRTWGIDGKLYATIHAGPSSRPANSLLSADNTIALLPAAAGTVEVWRVFDNQRIAEVSGLPELTGLDISDDGQLIALSHDMMVDIWSVGQSAK